MTMSDLLSLEVQPMQVAEYQHVLSALQGKDIQFNDSYVVFKDGSPLICYGGVELWYGHHSAWTFVSKDIGSDMLAATRAVRRHITGRMAEEHIRRISCSVRTGWEEGARWAAMLGFHRECTMRCYGPHWHDYDLWSMVK